MSTYFGSIAFLVVGDPAVNNRSPCQHGAHVLVGDVGGQTILPRPERCPAEGHKEETLCSQVMFIIGAALLL